ncbi:MAG: NYN domain-containing protein [Scytolyngbya sp. HA4215-MV1]|nr:NYN domain-containing protein [Scytolyngbya sp. HA4215-MV1]
MEFESSADPLSFAIVPNFEDVESSVVFEPADPIEDTLRNRVVILIDGSNLFYAASNLGLEIDYLKLLRCLIKNRRLVRAYFYTGADRTNEKQQGFLHWMRRNGYRVVAKDLIQFPDGSRKANVGVEIAVDMMKLASYCDEIVLLSGDGNLAYAVNAIAYRGVQIEVVSLRSMTSDSLINVADRYIDLAMIKADVQRTARER